MNKKLSEMTLDELWQLFPIFLTEHKSYWADWYNEEKALLQSLLPPDVEFHHIGSTAINGIMAKPIIDILVVVDTVVQIKNVANVLGEHGYLIMSSSENRISLNKGYTENGFAEKVYHLHIRLKNDIDEIYFRDYLNAHPEIAKEYEELKLRLWKEYEHNRDAYTASKTEFVKRYTNAAKRTPIGVYFSGTGNTKHCVRRFVSKIDTAAPTIEMESCETVNLIKNKELVVFGYPVYYSYLPKIVRDFIVKNQSIWQNKKVFVIATMGAFSGDGAGCAARLFKKYGATVLGGLHIKMPDCIGDVKLLKKSLDQNRRIISQADCKIDIAANNFKKGKYTKEGLNVFCRIAGLFGQRLYFGCKTKHYYAKIKCDRDKCLKCGLCVSLCPMKNIKIAEDRIAFNNNCTMCYRCFANCPQQAITVLGKKVYEQCKYEKYKTD